MARPRRPLLAADSPREGPLKLGASMLPVGILTRYALARTHTPLPPKEPAMRKPGKKPKGKPVKKPC